jgi:predicted transcriptional regulator
MKVKKCKNCKKTIKANNKLFCCEACRKEFNAERDRERIRLWQRARNDKKAEKPSPQKVKCLICGKWYKQVGTHIVQVHKMTAREYREEYGFDVKKGQLAGAYKQLKRDQAIENGTVENLKKGKKYWFKKGQEGIGKYKRSDQTMERLRNQARKLVEIQREIRKLKKLKNKHD